MRPGVADRRPTIGGADPGGDLVAALPNEARQRGQPTENVLDRSGYGDVPNRVTPPRDDRPMSGDVVIDMSGNVAPAPCTCEVERLRTVTRRFEVAPSAGGGTTAWDAALGRLLARLVLEPVHCIVITQDPFPRYAQLMIGHGRAIVEASGNAYLRGDFRLGRSEELALQMLGLAAPGTHDDGVDRPSNWRREEAVADPFELAHLVGTVLHDVMGLDVRAPITIEVFGAEWPCAACAWGETTADA